MPSHTTITDAAAKRFACKSGRVDHFDGSHPGLVLRVSATGRKTWMYFYRTRNGKVVQHRMKLGLFPEMGVQEAHDAWRKARDLVAAGRDPLAVDDKELPAKSFVSVFEEWLKLDRVKKNGQPKRSMDQVERALRRIVLPSWKDRLITDIDRRAALAVLDALNNEGKSVQANRVHSYLHRMFAWCVGREIIDKNPLEKVERVGAEVARTRALSDTELAKVWRATDKLKPEYRDFYRIIILTAARREEIAQLCWDEIRDDHIYLEGERTKNGEPHVIPLSSAARAIIAGIERKGRFVFSARGSVPIQGIKRAKKRLDDESGVSDWRTHDIRRTVANGLQKLGVPLVVTESILGHSGGSRSGIVKVYQTYGYDSEKRAALEAWGAHVMALIEGREPGKVVAFGGRQINPM